jgi:ankyrin repeat protein
MTSQQLPERPNLEQLKKQAKTLLHAAQAKDSAALSRLQALPAFAKQSIDELRNLTLALHDAQSVIAREHGFASWNALREHVEERALSFSAAVDEFVRCATGGASARAHRLLALHPAIAQANLQTALVLGDAAAVDARLKEKPELAKQPGGIQDWEPLLYVCHTCLHTEAPARANGLVAIARQLLTLGANPNATYSWRWHPELPRTALWGAICAMNHLPLAEALLEAGANPTDGVSLQIAGGTGPFDALELLRRHGVNVNGIPGGVPPLRYVLGYATDPTGPRWLLEHGADPNLAWGDLADAPLHIAAERWDVAMVELLVHHGADILRRRADGRTAHTQAELHGNHAIATWLLAHGATDELSPLDRFIAACARGDRASADAMLQARPALPTELRTEHHLMLHVPAERGDAAVLETMLACGFDPRAKDKDNVTALHRAAMAGRTEAVRVLLTFGAPVNALDGMFSGTPLVWAVEGWSSGQHAGADHPAVARLLIAGGSSIDWNPPAGTPGPERILEALVELRRAAARTEDAGS